MRIILSIFIPILAMLLASPLAAAEKSYNDRMAALEKEAESGNVEAQCQYADELTWTFLNTRKALEWYNKAAEAGNAYAKIGAASLELAGMKDGSPQQAKFKEEKCPKLKPVIEELQKRDTPEAAYYLWDVYINGICEPVDAKKANEYLVKAADGGMDKAQCMLGRAYLHSEKDSPKALKMFEKAYKGGMPAAALDLATCYFSGIGTEKSDAEAMKVVDSLVAQNIPAMNAMLGFFFYRGVNNFPKDMERGKSLLEKASKEGVEKAAEFLKKIASGKTSEKVKGKPE